MDMTLMFATDDRDILYKTDIFNYIVKLIVHSPVGKPV